MTTVKKDWQEGVLKYELSDEKEVRFLSRWEQEVVREVKTYVFEVYEKSYDLLSDLPLEWKIYSGFSSFRASLTKKEVQLDALDSFSDMLKTLHEIGHAIEYESLDSNLQELRKDAVRKINYFSDLSVSDVVHIVKSEFEAWDYAIETIKNFFPSRYEEAINIAVPLVGTYLEYFSKMPFMMKDKLKEVPLYWYTKAVKSL